MSDCSTHAFDVPLKSCPFCSAEPEVLSDGRRTWGLVQHNEGCLFPVYPKHEIPESDFAAWNTRAAMEFDGWFYLPKPKEGITNYCMPELTVTDNGFRVRQTVDVVNEAARKWGDELGEYVMQRICEIWNSRAELGSGPPYDELLRCLENDWNISASWDGLRRFWNIELTEEGVRLRDAEPNSRAERTCENMDTDEDSFFRCSVCNMSTLTEYMSSGYGLPSYCPNCGAKVVGE